MIFGKIILELLQIIQIFSVMPKDALGQYRILLTS